MVSLSGKSLCVEKLRCNCTTTDFGGRRAAQAIDQDRQSTADFSGTISKKESLYYYERERRKAKPATNPDVHQTRQDCNCVLAIPMQVVKKEAENVLKNRAARCAPTAALHLLFATAF